jgi:hypothetical protein
MDTEFVVAEKSASVLTQLIIGKGVGRSGFYSVAGTAPTALNLCFGFLLEKVQNRNLRIYRPFTSAGICREETKRNLSNLCSSCLHFMVSIACNFPLNQETCLKISAVWVE